MFQQLKDNKELWELFTKQEEYNPQLRDRHQRFPYSLSKHRNVLEPEVSASLVKNGMKPDYPGGKRFAVCLTHDIDSVYFPLISAGKEVLQAMLQGKPGKSLKTAMTSSGNLMVSIFDKSKNPARNFDKIIAMEKKYGAKSSFYFLLSGKNNRQRFEGCKVERLKEDLRMIAEEGWEIGLHGSYNAYIDPELIKSEKTKLENVIGREITGYRNHYLRFEIPTTWELLKEAGFRYDTTFGYADQAGFRNGMCHPFQPFSLNTGRYIDIWEIPLTIMDSTLFSYMGLDMNASWEITRQLIDTVEKHSGVITILWHNISMNGEPGELYERILQYCHEKSAWMTSAEDIWLRASEYDSR